MKLDKKTARTTGLLYLGMAIAGLVSYILISQSLFVDGNALETATNLVDHEALARIGIAAEMGVVIFQALAAVWFYKLFSKNNNFISGLIAVFGMVNAIAIMISSAAWLGSLNSALANQIDLSLMLYELHQNIWLVSSLFFGLWLIPMGYMVKKSKMPNALAWILMIGGVGYVLSAFTAVLLPDMQTVTDLLPMLASVGEFWIIGYLLFVSKIFK